MKIRISFEVETTDEAREILRAVDNLAKAPYRLEGFGAAVVKDPVPVEVEEDWDLFPTAATAQRVGGETLSDIKSILEKYHCTAKDVNNKLGRPTSQLGQTEAVLSLLVRRGVLQFNGSEYRVKPGKD